MANKLDLIKKLRGEGASIRMIDDVAGYIGSYESPVFVATVEFIVKIKNMIQSVMAEQEVSVGVEAAGKDSTENVDFAAAKSAVSGDDEMSEDERFKIMDAISAVELQHVEGREVEKAAVVITPKDEQKKKLKTAKGNDKAAKTSLLDRLLKNLQGQRNRQQAQVQHDEHGDHARQAAGVQRRSNAARMQQQHHHVEAVHAPQSHAGMRLLKMDILKVLKLKKDPTMMGQEKFKAHKEAKEFVSKIEVKAEEKKIEKKPQKVAEEISVSKLIDNLVKEPKVHKEPKEHHHKEEGKFAAKVESAAGPKANDENVAKMEAREAIAKLQGLGVKSADAPLKVKQEIAQNPAHEKQRQI